jgi:hypothetical protein
MWLDHIILTWQQKKRFVQFSQHAWLQVEPDGFGIFQ